MGNAFVSCSFLLLLLVMQSAARSNVLRLPSENSGDEHAHEHDHLHHGHGHGHGHSSATANMGGKDLNDDPTTKAAFQLDDLKVGKRRPVYFPTIDDLSKSFSFLPKDKADSIPFSSKALPSLLKLFSFSKDSKQAEDMDTTLKICEFNPIKGERRRCVTSLESMLDFALTIFESDHDGSRYQVKFLRTSPLLITNSTLPILQNYTVLEQPVEVANSKVIACHTMPYPYLVHYCHTQETETKAFKVLLGGDNGDVVEASALCHMDTSEWDPNHVLLRTLHLKPGVGEACHYFPEDHLILVPDPIH